MKVEIPLDYCSFWKLFNYKILFFRYIFVVLYFNEEVILVRFDCCALFKLFSSSKAFILKQELLNCPIISAVLYFYSLKQYINIYNYYRHCIY